MYQHTRTGKDYSHRPPSFHIWAIVAFEGLPHLQGGVIDNQEDATGRLNELIDEMNRRYAVLKENKVANIFDLNSKTNPTEQLSVSGLSMTSLPEWMITPITLKVFLRL